VGAGVTASRRLKPGDPADAGEESPPEGTLVAGNAMVRLKTKTGLSLLALAALALLAIAACSGSRATSGGSGASIGTLDPAQFPACASQGREDARSLLKGLPESLDPNFASIRAQILQQPQASRDGLI
jgi:hypothetical protein